jgi:hypothetical protein
MPGPSRRYMPGFLLDAAVFPSFDDTRVRDAITGMAPETRAAVLNGSLPYVPDTNFPGEPEEEEEEEEVVALQGSEPSVGSNSQESGAGESQYSNSQGSTDSRVSARYRSLLRRPGGLPQRQPFSFEEPSSSPERVSRYDELCAGIKTERLLMLEPKRQHFVSTRGGGSLFTSNLHSCRVEACQTASNVKETATPGLRHGVRPVRIR